MDGSKTVLVTGGAGYVGSHACKALAARGYDPVVLDSLENGHREAVRWGSFEHGTLLDRAAVTRCFARYRPSAVLHFAAYAYVGESVRRPASYYRNNLTGTLNLLDAMLDARVNNIVFSSTCSIYGVPDRSPITEDAARNPINPYGRSKLVIERILEDYAGAYGIRSCSLRYFNAAGADPAGDIGEVHDPEPHLIPNVLRAGAGAIDALHIYGDDYPTRDGTCIRDFVHVTDLAEAHCLALEYLRDREGTHAFNLGSEAGATVLEVVNTAESELGLVVPCRMDDRRTGDPPVLVADSTRAREELGWSPAHSTLEEILQTAWRWEKSEIAAKWRTAS